MGELTDGMDEMADGRDSVSLHDLRVVVERIEEIGRAHV